MSGSLLQPRHSKALDTTPSMHRRGPGIPLWPPGQAPQTHCTWWDSLIMTSQSVNMEYRWMERFCQSKKLWSGSYRCSRWQLHWLTDSFWSVLSWQMVMLELLLQSVHHFAGLQFYQWIRMIHAPLNLLRTSSLGKSWLTVFHPNYPIGMTWFHNMFITLSVRLWFVICTQKVMSQVVHIYFCHVIMSCDLTWFWKRTPLNLLQPLHFRGNKNYRAISRVQH